MPLYLIRAGNGPVRICYRPSNSALKLEPMQEANAEKLTVVGQRDHWGKNAVAALHERFARFHIRGEWFQWTDEMMEVLQEGIQRRTGKPTGKVERNQRIIERLLNEETTMSDVAKEEGISRERVRQIAKDHYGATARSLGIIDRMGANKRAREAVKAQTRDERARLKAALTKRAVKLRRRGMSQRLIADELGIFQSQVSALLIKAGYRSRPTNTRR